MLGSFPATMLYSCYDSSYVYPYDMAASYADFGGATLQNIAGNFERANATYVTLQGLQKDVIVPSKFYIGSTTTSVHSRQDARIRKYRLLQEGQFANAELMLHYCIVHGDLSDAVIFPMSFCSSEAVARTQECRCIHV